MKDTATIKNCIVMTIVSALLVGIIYVLTMPALISLSGDRHMFVECGDVFTDPGASVRFGLGTVSAEGFADSSRVGDYEIVYTFFTEKITRKVSVVDTTRPEIELLGSSSISVQKGGTYVEQGYTAFDIADGDITDRVWTETDLDLDTVGEYHISYYVSDASGNTTRERRRVDVTEKGPMAMDMISFDLDPYYPDVICKEVPFDKTKYENTVIFGDSFIGYMRDYRVGIVENLWSKGGMVPDQIYTTEILLGGRSLGLTFFGAMDRFHPESVIILLGNQVSHYWTPDYFRTVFDGIYRDISIKYPDTSIIICSICPFSVEGDSYNISTRGFSRNDRINKINTVYCDLCRKYGFRFMNVAEVLKDPASGYCRKEYIGPDYFHLSKTGFEVMLEYIKAHMDW